MTEDGTAQHGNDFDRIVAGTATVAPGATSVRIPVVIKGDVVSEGEESFTLRITGVTNATLVDGVAIGTILDDDAAETAAALP